MQQGLKHLLLLLSSIAEVTRHPAAVHLMQHCPAAQQHVANLLHTVCQVHHALSGAAGAQVLITTCCQLVLEDGQQPPAAAGRRCASSNKTDNRGSRCQHMNASSVTVHHTAAAMPPRRGVLDDRRHLKHDCSGCMQTQLHRTQHTNITTAFCCTHLGPHLKRGFSSMNLMLGLAAAASRPSSFSQHSRPQLS